MLLPIVERELRVAARQPATSLLRFLVPLVGIILWLALIATSPSPGHVGSKLFSVLAFLLFVCCLFAGVFLTADCLSIEKREGTLGLLFLTDLRAYDIVLGKLASTSLKAAYSLVAALPVLALSLLLGGVTGAEFWRAVLTLLVTLFLSLTCGLFMSAITRQSRSGMGATFLFLLFVTAVLPLAFYLILDSKVPYAEALLCWPSPGFLFQRSAGLSGFWPSLGVNIAMALALLAAACIALPRSWRDRVTPSKVRRVRLPLRRFTNPYCWLARRGQPPVWLVWGLVILGAAASIGLMMATHLSEGVATNMRRGWWFAAGVLAAFAAHQLFKYMVAAEASRGFSDDRRNGTMELLLVSPVSAAFIINGQRRALAALFRRPAWTLVLLNLSLIFIHYRTRPFGPDFELWLLTLTGGMALVATDYYALSWTGMWLGLRSPRHHRAVLGTLLRIMLPPWAIPLLAFVGFFRGWLGLQEMVICWIFLGTVLSLMNGHFAQTQLRRYFRIAATTTRVDRTNYSSPTTYGTLVTATASTPDKSAAR